MEPPKLPVEHNGHPPAEMPHDIRLGDVIGHFSTRLTRSWGPFLAFIGLIATLAILAMEVARSDTAAMGMMAVAITGIVAALIARMKGII